MLWYTQAKAALSLAQKMNPMEAALKLNDRVDEGLLAARSQILDTDFAAETAKSTQAQIVEQASISVRAQAKSSDEQVLGLLASLQL